MKNNSFLTFLAFLLCVGYLPAQTLIQDADLDTRVETERLPDQDIIWFRRGGIDRMRLIGSRLEFLNNGSSIFIGDNAGAVDDLSSNQNIFIGENAGTANVTGAFNVAMGRAALRTSVTGSNNIAIGTNSLQNTTSSTNLGLGASTLVENTSGERNVAIGFNAIRASITASGNTGIGSESLRRALDSDNMGIGWRAGYNLTNGTGNVFIGNEAGRGGAANTPYTASGNIFIGNQAGYNEIGSNKLYIANSSTATPLIQGDFANNRAWINGNFGVGINPTRSVDILTTVASGQNIAIQADAVNGGNDIIEMQVPTGVNTASFIEFQQASTIVANIATDGSSQFHSQLLNGKTSGLGDGNLEITENSVGGFNRITLRDDGGSDFWDVATLVNDSTNAQMRFFYQNYDGSNARNILNIDGNTHKIGVNTTTPSAFLDVRTDNNSTSQGISAQVNYVGNVDVVGVSGISEPAVGYGVGVAGTGGYMGLRATNDATTDAGTTYGVFATSTSTNAGARYGVYGSASGGTSGTRYGVRGVASGGTTGNRYGVYGSASGGDEAWGGYFPTKVYATEMRVGSLNAATGYKLTVDGKAICEELKVQNSVSWPDYVFSKDYNRLTLEQLDVFIQENGHLPNIPSAAQIEAENGFHVGEMANKTIEKVEELTLYMIEANREIQELKRQNEELRALVNALLEKK